MTSYCRHLKMDIAEARIPGGAEFWKLIEGMDIRLEVTGSHGVGKSGKF